MLPTLYQKFQDAFFIISCRKVIFLTSSDYKFKKILCTLTLIMFYYKREQIFIRFLFLSFMGAARKERKIFVRPQREPLSSECERVGGGQVFLSL